MMAGRTYSHHPSQAVVGLARSRFLACQSGGGAAEFAMVLPLLLMLLFGVIDAGRAMWTWNQAEKATHMGARYAVVTDMLAPALMTYSFASEGGLEQGEPVPESAFGGVDCTSTGCACKSGGTCPALGDMDSTDFDGIVDRMRAFLPQIEAENVIVEYRWSGLGFAGDPDGPDVSPLVTVRLQNLQFEPVTLLFFSRTLSLPDFSASLTLEDGQGSFSN